MHDIVIEAATSVVPQHWPCFPFRSKAQMKAELWNRVHYLSLGSNKDIAAFSSESPLCCLRRVWKRRSSPVRNKTEMPLIMGTYLSLHCEPWQPGWRIRNLNWSLAVVQNAAEWTTDEEAECPSDKIDSFSRAIVVLRCAFEASCSSTVELACVCHRREENICCCSPLQ